MNRKMISLLLALILASGTLASCGNPKDPAETAGGGTETETTANTAPAETAPETVHYAAAVPEGTDLGGMKFTVLAYPAEDIVWYDVDWNAEELTGEVVFSRCVCDSAAMLAIRERINSIIADNVK